MSALSFLGGLSGAYTAIDKGIKADEDRQQQLKDREYQAQQRKYEQGQQQRKLDEQAREDKMREADAAVPLTEQVADPNWKPEPVSANPVAEVTINPDGTETVNAPAEQKAPMVTRQRSMYDVFKDYAANRKAKGDTAGYLDYQQKAVKVASDQAVRQASNLIGQSANMTLEQYAQSAAKMFNNDALPQSITKVSPVSEDGSIDVVIKHNDTQQEMSVRFKTKDDLTRAVRAQYQPETFAKLLQAQEESAAKRRDELLKPYTLRPGERRQVMGVDGKVITIGEGNLPKGYELATDAAGNTVMRPSATAGKTTAGKAQKTAPDEASEYLKDAMGGKGDGSPEGAARYTRAQSYLDGIYATNPNLSPRTASAIAADAAADPSRVTLQLNNRTGLVSKVYSNPDFEGGKPFELGPNSGSVAEMEKLKGKAGMVQSVNGMVSDLAANVAPEQQAAFRTQLLKAATDPVARKAALDAAKANGQDVQAMTRQLDLIKTYAAPAAGPERTLKTDAGGIKKPQADPNSRAGQSQARQAQLRADAEKREAERLQAQQALSKQFQADKASMSPIDLARKYDSARGQLPMADAAELQRIESQAYRAGN